MKPNGATGTEGKRTELSRTGLVMAYEERTFRLLRNYFTVEAHNACHKGERLAASPAHEVRGLGGTG